ncbi:MAG: hypothetical protein ACTTKD_10045 [Peptoanaerobacter stomatis]|uniref:hypothetical protein n=1 Tax=Peptoanaerobacter stomatis TaxID=796937 RepID=UPI003F9FADF9
MFKLKTILLSALILSLSISVSEAKITVYDDGDYNNNTINTSADLDMDGKADKIVANPNSLKINNTVINMQLDNLDAYMNAFYGIDIIDINKKDNQKEIVMIYEATRQGFYYNYIFSYKNNKIEKIAGIQSDVDLQTDEKNNLLLAGNKAVSAFPAEYSSFFGSWPTIFTKYKLENNTFVI